MAKPTLWFYDDRGHERGPYEEFAIRNLIRSGAIQHATLLRKQTWTAPKTADKVFPEAIAAAAQSPLADRFPPLGPVQYFRIEVPEDREYRIVSWRGLWIGIAVFLLITLAELFSKSGPETAPLIVGAAFVGGCLAIVFPWLQWRAKFDRDVKVQNELLAQNRAKYEQAINLMRQGRDQLYVFQAQIEQEVSKAVTAYDARLQARADALAKQYLETVQSVNSRTLRADNYPTCKLRLTSAIESCRDIGLGVSDPEAKSLLSALKQDYEALLRHQAEQERQAALRKQMREEEKLRRDLKEQEDQARHEQKTLEKAVADALERAHGVHTQEVEELKKRLAEAESRAQRALSMAQQTKAGHVYILSNIGSFGPDVYKIGMTRRLDPQERVNELGSASVPFPFDVHALISCPDAPSLEHTLHQHLHRHRVNRVNMHKEYFHVPLSEIIDCVKANYGAVEYLADAEALQYNASLATTLEDLDYLESVHESLPDSFDEDV